MISYNNKRICELLLNQKLIDQEDLDRALAEQKNTGQPLEKILMDLGLVSEENVYRALSEYLGLPFLSASEYPETPFLGIDFSPQFMKQYKFFPLEMKDSVLSIATSAPLDFSTIDEISLFAGCKLKLYVSKESDILAAIDRQYGGGATTMERIIGDMNEDEMQLVSATEDEDINQLRDMASEAPIIKLVNLIITRGIDDGASDIHIEPFEDKLLVRLRIDGILHDIESPPKRLQAAITSRIKIMANLNIAERRLPQDGRVRLRVAGKKIDLRVSTVPTLYGESVVMRILDRSSILLTLEELGFPEDKLAQFEALIRKPHGIILVTGPTGSGKTTTLYAALEKINSPDKKIITVEDPVEYQLSGVNQIQVNPKIGLTFASGLRSIVRQDPDIMMIGEIRDLETAEIAIQSALTGHLVFSTLHTNDSCGAVTRLLDMGVEGYLVASCLEGVLAQRLVRTICKRCKQAVIPDKKVLASMNLSPKESSIVYRGRGCEECKNTGYRGRTGIYELLLINETIRRLIVEKTGANIIRQKAIQGGLKTLREDGWEKVKKGITTIEEVLRVTKEDEAEILDAIGM
ncbi:MAG: type II secretion system ATPase GspE [bacterium]|nr:type II secretion system ATPase GspE [bacterium]